MLQNVEFKKLKKKKNYIMTKLQCLKLQMKQLYMHLFNKF